MPPYKKGDSLAIFRTADDCYKVQNLGHDPQRMWADRVFPIMPFPTFGGRADRPAPERMFQKRRYVLMDLQYNHDAGVTVYFFQERVE